MTTSEDREAARAEFIQVEDQAARDLAAKGWRFRDSEGTNEGRDAMLEEASPVALAYAADITRDMAACPEEYAEWLHTE